MKAIAAQTRVELALTMRRGESLLATLAIPLGILIFFAKADFVDLGRDRPIDFLVPGVLALAVMSSAMVSLGIATAFERRYGVLKRLGATPLSRLQLLIAKTANVLMIELLQIGVITGVGAWLGWHFTWKLVPAAGLMLIGTIAFAAIGMLMAGTLRAEATLAVANGLYLSLMALGGMAYPLEKLPSALRGVVKILPSGALAEGLRGLLSPGHRFPAWSILVLAGWALAATLAAARWFRWEE